jgi:hypothetical protein
MLSRRPAARGKGKGKDINDVQQLSFREPYDSQFPGAIRKNQFVLAVMRDNKTWNIAKILEIRPDTSKA